MPQAKKATPLSTRSLAAYMTWKQFDILTLLRQEEVASTGQLSDFLDEIVDYDTKHGGAFYTGVTDGATYSSLRTLENRQLVTRHPDDTGLTQWSLTARASSALDWFENTRLYAA